MRAIIGVLAIAACAASPACQRQSEEDELRTQLVGRWVESSIGDVESTSGKTEMVFHVDGRYEHVFTATGKPPVNHGGRWKLVDREGARLLATCMEGERCQSGGLWTMSTLEINGDSMVTRSPTGGPQIRSRRLSPPP